MQTGKQLAKLHSQLQLEDYRMFGSETEHFYGSEH